jgi:APA family basic amino acid/polyamine antiporter
VLAAGPGFLLPENLSLRPADFLSRGFFEACALMFVAYTGYGRIATLGEEIREPRRNIPRAIGTAMAVISSVYLAVAVAAVGSVGAETLGKMTRDTAAPLESVLQLIGRVEAARWVSLGALAAMLGVLLNLLQGLSRVLLAMGREGDMPEGFARLHGGNPRTAVIGVGVLISLLAAVGDIRLSWSFSAFTVLIYYALTNLSALQLPQRDRRYPRGFAWAGLAGCLLLAFQVDRRAWLAGTALIAAGLLIRSMKNRWLSGRAPSGRGR